MHNQINVKKKETEKIKHNKVTIMIKYVGKQLDDMFTKQKSKSRIRKNIPCRSVKRKSKGWKRRLKERRVK